MARILVVEDEMLVAMLIEDAIVDLGHQIVGPAMRLETALDAATNETFDFAILDVNLAGKQSFPVADALAARGTPFMFASGYGRAGLADPYCDATILQKPFSPEQLAAILGTVLVARQTE
ncbi:Response regulator receiver domain-containing protein [Rhizobium sp. NFR07]|jgi:DNA-binding response OmpR family regulator|uniref:response regulator n=1 Tax=Rhizobium sp. NFR07 TaxID=1566262 RepID=UPI0008F3A0B6|nr:response regulator [Rhizobium sp. NFR07]SFA83480.1 Response regulator receiver domain-containing protein [Rhizobium sp. NFR07]